MHEHKLTSLKETTAKDIQISCYKNCWSKASKNTTIKKLFEIIKTGQGIKEKIVHLRTVTDESEIDRLKKELPGVTVSGLFGSDRKAESLTHYSGLIQIDIDKPNNRDELKAKLCKDEFSLAVFDSPTKTGIKIIVKVSGNNDSHSETFYSLSRYYKKNYNVPIDEKCKDVSRLLFLSFDENIFINYDSAIWVNPVNEKQVFENMLKWLQTEGEQFTKGNRNNFIYKLSAACFRTGVSESFTLTECLNQFEAVDLDETAIRATVKSGYNSKAYTQPANSKRELIRAKKPLSSNSKTITAKSIETKSPEKPESKPKNFSQMARVESYINSKYELRRNEVS